MYATVPDGGVDYWMIRSARLHMAWPQESVHICWICGNRVSLEKCKIDEQGQAVHEDCYVAKVVFQSGNTPQSPNPA